MGLTPYSLACESSVDTMKKMVCLEEHGYILSPLDIVWGAGNPFSSSEKTNEIFNYLFNEKGLSVNAIEEKYGFTPLHPACSSESIFGMKWLVEHKADISSFDRSGQTPFMWACKSSINRSAKVRYLVEKGANCQAKDYKGNTALFHATYNSSKCEDDEVKDVLRYLVIEKGININSVDKEGRTPLLYACEEHPSFLVIQQLIELGADVSFRNKNKKMQHIVAESFSSIDASVIDLLID
ncbi:26S proteasome non-ATPase regulatory subunit 10-like [Oscarella lobularis]|uniref:26S proteasome non-ATPase regulatory subunit 10-like n=1 Tax=Oscarella lobularis TaxID=121494 RepID=UPI00331374D0